MKPRGRFFRLPERIKENLFEEYGEPSAFAERHVGCDEHEKDLFRCGPNIGFFCENCGASVGDTMWLSHDQVDEDDWERARTDRDEVKEQYRQSWSAAKDRHLERLVEIGEERANGLGDDIPPIDAPGPVWHDYLRGLPKYSYEWKEAYKAYRHSNWWQSRRKRVLDHKGRTCQLQYDGCTGRATQVHHKSYDRIGFEPLHDLEPACRSCHHRLHEFEDEHVHTAL